MANLEVTIENCNSIDTAAILVTEGCLDTQSAKNAGGGFVKSGKLNGHDLITTMLAGALSISYLVSAHAGGIVAEVGV